MTLKDSWQKERKRMLNGVTVFNIREYLAGDDRILGEEQLKQILSEFFYHRKVRPRSGESHELVQLLKVL